MAYQKSSAPPPPPVAAAELLNRSAFFAPLRAGVQQLAGLERDIARVLPDYLIGKVTPAAIKNGVLTLFAAHSALAARLRHLAPGLVDELRRRGWPVSSLKVRVQLRVFPAPRPPKEARMTPTAVASVRTLVETLKPSPLREALLHLAERHASGKQS